MEEPRVAVSKDLKDVYDNYYNDGLEEWREIGARQKVENIKQVASNQQFNRLLEIGAGSGIILEKLSKLKFAKHFYALDISSSSIEQIKKKKIDGLQEVRTFDGYKTDYPDKHFDVVVLSHVLEHAEHPRMLLREIKRIGKHLIIEVPRDYKHNVDKHWKDLVSYGHINLYTPSLLRFLLNTEEFCILNDHMSLSSPALLRYGNDNRSFLQRLKIELSLVARSVAYIVFPGWRKETMINAYTVFCRTE